MQLMSYILLIKSSQLNNLKDQSSIRNFRSLLIENGLTEEIYNESKNNFSKTFIELIDTNKQPTIDDNNLVISNEAREEKSKKLNYKNQIKPYQIKHQEKNIHEPKQESRKEFNQNQKGKIPEDKKESSKIINEELSTKENTDIQNNNQDIKKPIKIKSLFDL
jgi:ABC-type proline/glycine betaine transport system ATPase subunit